MLNIQDLSVGILNRLNLHIQPNECVAILGKSGSGKTTLLNAIAGYLEYQGNIILARQNINRLPPWQRQCRYLNQRLYLFPHRTVNENLALAQGKHISLTEQIDLLQQLGIEHLIDRYPHQISGGEQQRVALARVLISHPKLLLLDEPFSSLDWDTRTQMWQIIKQIKTQFSLTILMVTHEPKEADYLAERAISIHHGTLKETL